MAPNRMKWANLLLVLVWAGSLIFPDAAGAIVRVGSFGPVRFNNNLEIVGDLAYGSCERSDSSSGLCIFDVSVPTTGIQVGFLPISSARRVAVSDGIAYVTRGFQGLTIADVSDPTNPVELATLGMPGSSTDVVVNGNIAYVADGHAGVRIVDVSTPTLPVEIGSVETAGLAFHMDLDGSILYVVSDLNAIESLQAIDISDPSTPIVIGRSRTLWPVSDIEIAGKYAYLTTASTGYLSVVDISNPAMPVFYFGNFLAETLEGFEIEGDRAYVATGSGLTIVDISNPLSPVKLAVFRTPGNSKDVKLHAGLVYVSDSSSTDSAVSIIDVSNLEYPRQISAVRPLGGPVDIALAGDFAHFAMKSLAAIRTFDISNASSPVEVGMFPGYGAAFLKVVGNIGYMGWGKKLRVFDLSIPSLPAELGSIELPSTVVDAEIENGLAYVVELNDGLGIVDVSDPKEMKQVGFLAMARTSRSVAVRGDVAYFGTYERFLVIDVSDPSAPEVIGSRFKRYSTIRDIYISGNLAYVVDGGLQIIDISNPERPTVLSDFPTLGYLMGAVAVTVIGKRAYLSCGYRGVRVFDVSDPSAPFEMGAITPPGGSNEIVDVEVRDGLVYAADQNSYLRIFEFGPEYESTITVGLDIMPGSDSNPINLASGGEIPVMIAGTKDFDVTDVDVSTLGFGPGGAPVDHSHGPHFDDLNGDGFVDLLAHFRAEGTGIAFGSRIACVTGKTLDEVPIEGCDAVRTVPDMDGDTLLDVEEDAIGTRALRSDTDRDGYDDGVEVRQLGTDPLDPLDPAPAATQETPSRRPRRHKN